MAKDAETRRPFPPILTHLFVRLGLSRKMASLKGYCRQPLFNIQFLVAICVLIPEVGAQSTNKTLSLTNSATRSSVTRTNSPDEIKFFRRRAEAGDSEAQYKLASACLCGNGTKRDTEEGKKWLERAAQSGWAEAQFMLGILHDGEITFEPDPTLSKPDLPTAVKWVRKAADQGHILAQDVLGGYFQTGRGVTQNDQEAARWFRKAAEQGNPDAQRKIGEAYMQGRGVAKDQLEAISWWRKAAQQGDHEAQSGLGFVLQMGEAKIGNVIIYKGIKKDTEESSKWLRKAAEKYRVLAERGDFEAQKWLAMAYKLGEGIKDPEESDKWCRRVAEEYRKGAEKGDARAQYYLASCYSTGEGVPKDNASAISWKRRAALQGDSGAQFSLGLDYYHGNSGVPKDYVQAYMWFNLSAADGEAGDNLAMFKREEVAVQMSPGQIEEAQRLTREFKPRKELGATFSPPLPDEIVSPPNAPTASGTGFFITEDGFLVTNEHVVRGATQIRLVTEAGLIAAKVVKVDAANDLALLRALNKQFTFTADDFLDAPKAVSPKKVEVMFTALPVVSSRSVKLGSTVATVGFPNIGLQGFAPKLAKGEIASISGANDDARYFQISVPVQPGNSGGALVDERGNVVGVVSAKLSARVALATTGMLPENVNYAIKSSFLLGFLESVPEVSAKLKEPNSKEIKFEDVVKAAEQAAVLVQVY